jgi:hypothetical protein
MPVENVISLSIGCASVSDIKLLSFAAGVFQILRDSPRVAT